MRSSLFKDYVSMLYRVSLTEEEEAQLIEYLSIRVDDNQDISAIREHIYDFVKTLYDISPSMAHANDNSDLEQMIKLIKAKADKK